MENFSELQSLWLVEEPHSVLPADEIENVSKQFVEKQKRKNVLIMLLLAMLIITSIWLLSWAQFALWTTDLGILIFATLAAWMVNLRLSRQNEWSHLEPLSNSEFLNKLQQKTHETCIGKSDTQAKLFSFWAIGFCFYIYEFVSASLTYLLLGYGMLLSFVLIVWFVYRPFMKRRYQKDIQKTINRINHLKSQIEDEE